MRYWDSSALVPLLIYELASERLQRIYRADPGVSAWTLTPVEIASALARKSRGGLDASSIAEAHDRLGKLRKNWSDVADVPRVRDRAMRLVDTHPLTAADALQLAAALVATEERPQAMGFVTLDAVLAEAARREGFAVEGM